jgi:predicted metal-binding membrane protein
MLNSAAAAPVRDPHWWCVVPSGFVHHGSAGPLAAAVAMGPMWMTMAFAAAMPAALPASQHVALNSFRRRRWRAVATFTFVYVGLWTAFGLVTVAVLDPLVASRTALFDVALALAALWCLTPLKRRALNRCHRSAPLPPRGWKATAGVVRFAWINASGCVGSCWLAMMAMFAAPTLRLGWGVGLAAVSAYEKLSSRPRRAVRRTSALLGVATIGVSLGWLVG